MKLQNFIKGVEILRQHYTTQDGYHLAAEHGQIYLYATDTPLSDVEFSEMLDLGWFQPDNTKEGYSQEDVWSAFV